MFNDRYGLTDAVLQGRKTMTRRIIHLTDTDKKYLDTAFDWDLRERVIIDRYAKYKVGEVLAVAQQYRNLAWDNRLYNKIKLLCPGEMPWNALKGWGNKMFVKADLMPHYIRITDIKVERLQNISDEDCMREGIFRWQGCTLYHYDINAKQFEGNRYHSEIEAFAALIDKVSGNGTWKRNPWVIVYTFKLIK